MYTQHVIATPPQDDPLFPRLADRPDQDAIVVPVRKRGGAFRYRRISFAALQDDVLRCAAGLQAVGIGRGMRIALLVPFGPDFIALVFAILKTGAQVVLADPGLGMRNLTQCLADANPDGFIAVPMAHAVRWWQRPRFRRSQVHVVVGRGWPGLNLSQLRKTPAHHFQPPPLQADDLAAIIFTSGSTGAAKGVQYTRGNFAAQVRQIQRQYQIPPGGIDLACFPLFGLFNATMGVTTVIPPMNTTRPATADPGRLVQVIHDLQIDQSFASPVVWSHVGRYCTERQIRLPTLRRVFAAGAPVAPRVLRQMSSVLSTDARMATPYGATEALPVATIDAEEVLSETAIQTANGAGICVGRRFAEVQWQVVEISDQSITTIDHARILPHNEIGELVVAGPQVTQHYATRTEANALHKIHDGKTVWHRMGDVGYLDTSDRFWFCGRKAHRVRSEQGTMFTICCEAIFNEHPRIYRSALVGIGEPGKQQPVIVCEPWPSQWPPSIALRRELVAELAEYALRNPNTRTIGSDQILLKRNLPVDPRHNAKILREQLVTWALRYRHRPLSSH